MTTRRTRDFRLVGGFEVRTSSDGSRSDLGRTVGRNRSRSSHWSVVFAGAECGGGGALRPRLSSSRRSSARRRRRVVRGPKDASGTTDLPTDRVDHRGNSGSTRLGAVARAKDRPSAASVFSIAAGPGVRVLAGPTDSDETKRYVCRRPPRSGRRGGGIRSRIRRQEKSKRIYAGHDTCRNTLKIYGHRAKSRLSEGRSVGS